MDFTDDQKLKLFESTMQIEGYLKELQQQIGKPVWARLPKLPSGMPGYDKLHLGKDHMFIESGFTRWENMYFDRGDIKHLSWWEKLSSRCIYNDYWHMLYLVLNWNYVKMSLHFDIEKEEAKQKLIDNTINHFVL